MNTLQDLLDAIDALDEQLTADERTAAIGEIVASISTEARTAMLAEADEATATIMDGEVDEQGLATLQTLAEATNAIRAANEADESAAAERAAAAAALAEQIRGSDQSGDDGDDGDEGETDDDEGETDDDESDESTVNEDEREAVAASAADVRQRNIRANARRPRSVLPPRASSLTAGAAALPGDIEEWGLVASANVAEGGNVATNTRITSLEDLSQALLAAVEGSLGFDGPAKRVKLFRHEHNHNLAAQGFDADRILGRDPIANQQRIARVASPQAIVAAGGIESIQAAGGICAPQQVNYDQPIVGSDDRPVRDTALTRFGADRGGVRLFPSLSWEDMEDAITVWDNDTDTTPGEQVKNCLSLTCPEDEESLVAAIVRCLEIGNFRSRFFGEQVEAWLRGAAIQHARIAESRLLTQIDAASTLVSTGQLLGALPDFVADLSLALAGIHSSRRISNAMPMRLIAPIWLPYLFRADEARRARDITTDEAYVMSDTALNNALARLGVTPTWTLDAASGDADQVFARQGDGALIGWPSTVTTRLYPEGSHLFLDGGAFDFGIVRDSVLNSTNDFQMFMETLEGHAYQGDVSYTITHDLCPSGQSAARADSSGVCSSGS